VSGAVTPTNSLDGVDRPTMLRLIQRRLAPFRTIAEIEAIWTAGGPDDLFQPVAVLNRLFYEHPAFFEDAEERVIDRESERLVAATQENDRASAEVCTFQVKQTHRIAAAGLPEKCAVHVTLPVPRTIEGVQGVRLLSCRPERVARHYLPTAGLFHDVPYLIGYGEALPLIEMQFEVTQSSFGLRRLADPELRGACPTSSDLEPGLFQPWIRRSVPEPSATPEEIVGNVLDLFEEELQFGLTEGRPEELLRVIPVLKVGNIETLSRLAAFVLSQVGFSTRLGAGQALGFAEGSGRSELFLPGSPGYDHRFLYWCHDATGRSGVFDLTYFKRWHFAATSENTRTAASRERLRAVGQRGRTVLRSGIYPVDLVVSGYPGYQRVVDIRAELVAAVAPTIDTQIVAVRQEG
jgi:hypothetical protein